jgi:ABC-type uncharacterized transport system permease subunit
MTDQDDLLLSALFRDADEDQIGLGPPAFALAVMAQVANAQAQRRALVDSLWIAVVACAAVIFIVMAPIAWPMIEASWIKATMAYGLNTQSLMLVTTLLLSGIGWAVAVRD